MRMSLATCCSGAATAATTTVIEVMPMGDIGGETRVDQYLLAVHGPLKTGGAVHANGHSLQDGWGLARYAQVEETGGKLGLITPLTHNFCESCNRVRLTCTGTLYMCLGQDDAADLRARCAHPTMMRSCKRRSARRLPESQRATTSSSTDAAASLRSPVI